MISIITTAYNIEEYLPICLDSILAQTFSDYELILVDDGSTDRSGAICEQYAKKDPRIRIFHQKNSGVSDAWNRALRQVRGEFVGFVDGDDVIHPRMYELLYKAIKETHSDIAYGDYQIFYGSGTFDFTQEGPASVSDDGDFITVSTQKEELERNLTIPTIWRGLYKTSVIRPFKFMRGRRGQDVLWSTCVLLNANKIVRVDKPLSAWRRRIGSESHLTLLSRTPDCCFIKRCTIDYLEEHAPEWVVPYTMLLFTTCVDAANWFPELHDASEKDRYRTEIQCGLDYFKKISILKILGDPHTGRPRKLLAAVGKISFPLACVLKKKLLPIINYCRN